MAIRHSPPSKKITRGMGRVGFGAFVLWLILLFLPGIAIYRLIAHLDWRYPAAYLAVIFVVTYAAYVSDKRFAEVGLRRIPESTLHLLDLAGGWPAAFIAQRRFRHKISKTSFQVVFGFIILIHQIGAVAVLMNFNLIKNTLRQISASHG